MEVKPIEYERWIFANDVGQDEIILLSCIEYEMQKAKDNPEKEYPVMKVLGRVGKYMGDFKITMWNRQVSELVDAWGTESKSWAGKLVEVYKKGSKLYARPAPSEKQPVQPQQADVVLNEEAAKA